MTTLIHAFSGVEAVLMTLARLWAVAGELFTAATILFCLNTFANAIRLTYKAGHAFGTFYRSHLHAPLKWLVVHAIALVILLCQLAWEGAQLTWANRYEIADTINDWRNAIGQSFSYQYA